jgi:RimJ/RimL family protein N-acetyltransferase
VTDELVCREVRATDAYRLHALEETPNAPVWAREVETWVKRDAFYWARDPDTRATLFIGEHSGDLIAVCGYSFERQGMWYIPGLLVEYSSRGIGGFGFAMLNYTVGDLRRRAVGQTVTWLVHPANHAMARLSTKVGAIPDGEARVRPLGGNEDVDYTRWRIDL